PWRWNTAETSRPFSAIAYGAFAAGADVADGAAMAISTSPPLTRSARVDRVRMSSFFALLCAPAAARPLVCSARRIAIAARAAFFMPRIIGDWGLGDRDWRDW